MSEKRIIAVGVTTGDGHYIEDFWFDTHCENEDEWLERAVELFQDYYFDNIKFKVREVKGE